MNLYEKLVTIHEQIISQKPVVLNLTNYVTMDFMANTLLALGSAPIMSEDIHEIKDLVNIANVVNLNIGTLNQDFKERALLAAKTAQKKNKCVILDPVGAGASKTRTELAVILSKYSTIIRGNASEIMALGNITSNTRGVESIYQTHDSEEIAKKIATMLNNTIVISGKTDLIITQNNKFTNNFGVELMTKVTGMGCVLTAVIGAFAAVEKDYAMSSLLAVTFYTLCAEKAYHNATAPANFKTEFIDNIYAPCWDFFQEKLSKGNN